jgi:hypothetical protein
VAGTVGAGDAGTVEHEGDRKLEQRHVHEQLVERAIEERRIHRNHRVQPTQGQAGR